MFEAEMCCFNQSKVDDSKKAVTSFFQSTNTLLTFVCWQSTTWNLVEGSGLQKTLPTRSAIYDWHLRLIDICTQSRIIGSMFSFIFQFRPTRSLLFSMAATFARWRANVVGAKRFLVFSPIQKDWCSQGWILREANERVVSGRLSQRCREASFECFGLSFCSALLKSLRTALESHLIRSEASHVFFQINARVMCKCNKGGPQ